MRIVTWNVNGLRAAIRKGFQKHIDAIRPDILLLQEVRARPEQLPEEFQQPDGWHVVWNPTARQEVMFSSHEKAQKTQRITHFMDRVLLFLCFLCCFVARKKVQIACVVE